MRKLTEDQVRALVKRKLENQTMASIAGEMSISTAYLCDFIQGKRGCGDKIAAGLGLRREVYYVQDPSS
jgi:hypothetical protein